MNTKNHEVEWILGNINDNSGGYRVDGRDAVYLFHSHAERPYVAQAEKIETERFWCPRCFEFAPKHIVVLAHMMGAILDMGRLGDERKETKLREE